MTDMSVREAIRRGLCRQCWGRGRISYTSEDDVSVDDETGAMMANAVMRYQTCPSCNGRGRLVD
jgi:DnaJ-class molecular chaperone